jgi:hypothetical protein
MIFLQKSARNIRAFYSKVLTKKYLQWRIDYSKMNQLLVVDVIYLRIDGVINFFHGIVD